jgi:hypothetical protein
VYARSNARETVTFISGVTPPKFVGGASIQQDAGGFEIVFNPKHRSRCRENSQF